MEESATAEIQEGNGLILNVEENSESEREAKTSTGNESQKEELHSEANASTEYFIYRVPDELRHLNDKAYSPTAILIGPFHRSYKKFETMEKLKKNYFEIFLQEGRLQRENVVQFMMDREEKVRRCYEVQMGRPINSDDYVEMIMLDASFIIVIFLISKYPKWWRLCREDQLQTNFSNIVRDICLLENQLPFFVIEELYNFASTSCPNNYPPDHFTQLAFAFFKNFHTPKLSHHPGLNPLDSPNIKHLVDLFRTFLLPLPYHYHTDFLHNWLPHRNGDKKSMYLNTATKLDEAGVKFKVGGSRQWLVDLKFKEGVLEIPCLELNLKTESLFRNLVALEQRYYKSNAYITDYIRFLDCLIDTEKDVDLLVQKRVLINGLGDSQKVTTFFNDLGAHIRDSDMNPYYYHLSVELNKYSMNFLHGSIVRLRRDYFNNPWRSASTIAAIILLVLTFIQTVCSIISLRQN